jgi:hypothetical protein
MYGFCMRESGTHRDGRMDEFLMMRAREKMIVMLSNGHCVLWWIVKALGGAMTR